MLIKVKNRAFELPGVQDSKKWNNIFTFALLADPQLGLYRNNHSWEEEEKQLRECIVSASSADPPPAFIVILGDLVHAPVPALTDGPEAVEQRRVRDEQARDLAAAVDASSKNVPVLVIPGNHDLGSAPRAESIADYEKLWGKDYFSFWVGGVKFVLANSCLFYDDTFVAQEAERQLAWIEEEFQDAVAQGAKHIFFMQHHQFYYKSWDEQDETEATIEVRQMKSANKLALFRLSMKWRQRLLPLLKKYKVVLPSCGFAINDARPGYRIIKVQEDGFEQEGHAIEWRTNNYPFLEPRFP